MITYVVGDVLSSYIGLPCAGLYALGLYRYNVYTVQTRNGGCCWLMLSIMKYRWQTDMYR